MTGRFRFLWSLTHLCLWASVNGELRDIVGTGYSDEILFSCEEL
jgi:hypothetical protein